MDLKNKSEEELREIAEALHVLAEKKKYNYIDFLFPDKGPLRREKYPKHIDFLNAGADNHERAFIAANRVGKSLTGLYEMVLHCTGKYPHWWQGRRFKKAVECWLGAEDGKTIRDSLQQDLVGRGEMWTGLISKDCVARDPLGMEGVGGGYGQYFIRHVSGGISRITVKTYCAGVETFKAASIDVVMLDEQCPLSIYTECLIRTVTTRGIVYLTFTPDNGATDTVLHFLNDPYRFKVKVGWDDIPHMLPEERERFLKSIPPHLIACKTQGEVYLGSGAIYPVAESEIIIVPFAIPKHWPRCFSLDPGWNRTAVLWGAYDVESDCWYLYSEYYAEHTLATVHAKAIKSRGAWIPGICDPATEYGGKGKDGISYLPAYEEEGLNLSMANNKEKDSQIFEVYERLSTSRLKVFSTLKNFFYEYRMYRRDDKGKIVKKNDHLMDAMQYMMQHGHEIAITEPNPIEDDNHHDSSDDRNEYTGY